MNKSFSVTGKVWRYPGVGGWHFVYVGKKESAEIRKIVPAKVGFGFIKIVATLGSTSWNTTLFPTKEGPYLVAIKANVRKAESVDVGNEVEISFRLK